MKVCLVVCLALAHLATASLFKNYQARDYQGLNILPLNYIDPTSYNQLLEQQVQYQTKRDNQRQNRHWSHEDKSQERQRSQESRSSQESKSQESSKSQENRGQDKNNNKHALHPETVELNSNEAQRVILEPRDQSRTRNSQQDMSRSSEEQSKTLRPFLQKAIYGDAVEWKGIRMAAAPSSAIADQKDISRIFKGAYKTVQDLTEDQKKNFHDKYTTEAQNEDTKLNATQLLQKNNYAVEEHTVKTDDGYLLTLIRIPPKQKNRDIQKRPVVFLMHGLLGSADDWLLSGPHNALAYLLAENDFDVWMGNARGSKYSRRHVSKHPGQPDFWQFSIDEIALQDLPAMIDYALNTTRQQKLNYVGFSEGNTAFFALASARPQYNDKINMMYALAPMVYMSHTLSPLMKMIAPSSPLYERLHEILGHGEFKPSKDLIQTVGGNMLANKLGCKHVASNINFVMAGMVDDNDVKIVPMIASHSPAGASTRQMKQYGQAVASGQFRRYDFGSAINQKVYGSEKPPKYEMSKVRAPVTLVYSDQDWLAQPADVERLRSELPQVMEAYKVPQQNFSHLDFQFSNNAFQAVYQRLIESLQKNAQKSME